MTATRLQALVHGMRFEARNTLSLELRPAHADVPFPAFEPGAHIDLHLGDGLVRSYSLLNDSSERGRYVIGVLRDANSRGGSRYVHEQLRVGAVLPISAPRNNFRLDEAAPRSVLVAGGIGVTPLLGMLRRLVQLQRPVHMVYGARSKADAAFLSDIEALTGPLVRLTTHFDDVQGGPPRLEALLAGEPADVHVYGCGPAPMLAAFEAACGRLGYRHVHIERFAAHPVQPSAPSEKCTVQLQRSGTSVEIPAGMSILEALIGAGISIDHSCREGVCGSCETRIVEGQVEHLDSILTKAEKAASKSMMVCVSRCKGDTLVLDL